jgi:hypothetical protein
MVVQLVGFGTPHKKTLHQHRPLTATSHVSTKVMCNSKFMELSGTLLLRKERREKKGDKHRNPSPKQDEPRNPSWNRSPFLRKKKREKGRQATEPQPEEGRTSKS